jgi:hypothetical protein
VIHSRLVLFTEVETIVSTSENFIIGQRPSADQTCLAVGSSSKTIQSANAHLSDTIQLFLSSDALSMSTLVSLALLFNSSLAPSHCESVVMDFMAGTGELDLFKEASAAAANVFEGRLTNTTYCYCSTHG